MNSSKAEIMTATPRPWYLDRDSESGAVDIRCVDPMDGTGWGIATVWHQSGGSHDPARPMADATLIVRAVNAHDELVAALKAIMAALDQPATQDPARPGLALAWETARALLAWMARP